MRVYLTILLEIRILKTLTKMIIKILFHLQKEESQYLNLIQNFLIKIIIFIKSPLIRKILMIGYGVNILFMRLLVVKERLIEFGVRPKSSLQTNSIFCLRTLNQMESSSKKFLGTGFHN